MIGPWLLLLGCASEPVPEAPTRPTGAQRAEAAVRSWFDTALVGHLPGELHEVSGMARGAQRTWAVNDSNNDPVLFAFDLTGTVTDRVTVTGAHNHDWEDLASFEQDGRRMLVVADTGDNKALRDAVALYLLPEPPPGASTAAVEQTVPFTYPDGPRDCEAVAIDAAAGVALLLTKRDEPPRLYALPLASDGPRVATLLGTVETLPPPTPQDLVDDPKFGYARSQPTALDLQGRTLLVQTYKDAYLYERRPSETWLQATQRPPLRVDCPQLSQTESACFLQDGSILVSSEGGSPPLYQLLPKAPSDEASTAP